MRKLTALVGLAVLALSACAGVKDKMGLAKQSPDEFMVMSRAPLSLPPDYTERPVASIEQANQVKNPFNNKYNDLSSGERKFLQELSANKNSKK